MTINVDSMIAINQLNEAVLRVEKVEAAFDVAIEITTDKLKGNDIQMLRDLKAAWEVHSYRVGHKLLQLECTLTKLESAKSPKLPFDDSNSSDDDSSDDESKGLGSSARKGGKPRSIFMLTKGNAMDETSSSESSSESSSDDSSDGMSDEGERKRTVFMITRSQTAGIAGATGGVAGATGGDAEGVFRLNLDFVSCVML